MDLTKGEIEVRCTIGLNIWFRWLMYPNCLAFIIPSTGCTCYTLKKTGFVYKREAQIHINL